jgi:DNA-binding transcriptional ArsR family regulator
VFEVGGPTADVFGAIANPVRRALLDSLRTGPQPVHELAAAFAISRPAVSQHLRVLRDADLVAEETCGGHRRYRLEPGPLREVEEWVASYEQFWRDRLVALREVLDKDHEA